MRRGGDAGSVERGGRLWVLASAQPGAALPHCTSHECARHRGAHEAPARPRAAPGARTTRPRARTHRSESYSRLESQLGTLMFHTGTPDDTRLLKAYTLQLEGGTKLASAATVSTAPTP